MSYVAVMYTEQIVEAGTRDQMFGAPSHPYTSFCAPFPTSRGSVR